jgi:hypothetical protein
MCGIGRRDALIAVNHCPQLKKYIFVRAPRKPRYWRCGHTASMTRFIQWEIPLEDVIAAFSRTLGKQLENM